MKDDRQSKVYLILFLAIVVLMASWSRVLKSTKTDAADPGFANYSIGLETEAPADFEVNELREAEEINSGLFKPFVVGDLGDES